MSQSSVSARWGRVGVTIVVIVIVQTIVFALATFPAIVVGWAAWQLAPSTVTKMLLIAVLSVPLYVLFALTLLAASPLANRYTGAYTPAQSRLRIAELEWPLLRWARYMVADHLVKMFAGQLFQGSPLWSWYLRLNGARVGRRVFVNTTAISDHNLLDLGDDVVIGAAVHLSGHTVEDGVLITDRVQLAAGVTVGIGAVVLVGTVADERCQIGALSLVPKYARLCGHAVYTGVPARRL